MATIYIKLFLLFVLIAEIHCVENMNLKKYIYNPIEHDNTNLYRAISRSRRATDDDEYSNTKYYEYTDNGIIIKGGRDLPSDFKGSGTSDFAFDGDSFKWMPRRTERPKQVQNTATPENTENTIQKVSPYPNNCQYRCHHFITSEYNPICGSDGVTYYNPGKFKCAVKCGKRITGKQYVSCGFGAMMV